MAVETILALDASGAACSAALWRRDAVVAHRFRLMTRGHAEALIPMIVETMADAGMRLDSLDAVAVTVGPGAFTGIRIGLAAARGIVLATSIPAAGVTTFAAVVEAIPAAERDERDVMVLLDSKRGDLFVQRYTAALDPIGPPAIAAPEAVAHGLSSGRCILAGDGIALVRPHLEGAALDIACSTANGPADALHVVRLAARRIDAGGGLPPEPLYLRAPEVRLAPVPTASRNEPPACR